MLRFPDFVLGGTRCAGFSGWFCWPRRCFSGCSTRTSRRRSTSDLDRTRLGNKIGRSQWQSVLWAVAWGDAGTQAAAQQGGLTVINHADTEMFVIFFGVYASQTTILYGE